MAETVTTSASYDPDTMVLFMGLNPYGKGVSLGGDVYLRFSPFGVGEGDVRGDGRPVLDRTQRSGLGTLALDGIHFLDAEQVLPRVREAIAGDDNLKGVITLETLIQKKNPHPRVIAKRDVAEKGPWDERSIKGLAALFAAAYTASVGQNLSVSTLQQHS